MEVYYDPGISISRRVSIAFGIGLVVLGHLVSGPLEAALDVEAFVLGGAIEDLLICCRTRISNRHDKPVWDGVRKTRIG